MLDISKMQFYRQFHSVTYIKKMTTQKPDENIFKTKSEITLERTLIILQSI